LKTGDGLSVQELSKAKLVQYQLVTETTVQLDSS